MVILLILVSIIVFQLPDLKKKKNKVNGNEGCRFRLGDIVRLQYENGIHDDGIITYLDKSTQYAELTKMSATMCTEPYVLSTKDWIEFHYDIQNRNMETYFTGKSGDSEFTIVIVKQSKHNNFFNLEHRELKTGDAYNVIRTENFDTSKYNFNEDTFIQIDSLDKDNNIITCFDISDAKNLIELDVTHGISKKNTFYSRFLSRRRRRFRRR